MSPRDSKAMTDLCEYHDPPTAEQTMKARRVVAGNATDAADAAELMKMLGLFPGQEREYEPITAPPVPINRVGP